MKLELEGMTKRFGSVVANDDISLVVEPGQIHSLLGENGAGKSTLMNLLFGLYRPDAGRILLDGAETSFTGPGDAMAAGIGMVHQHFMLVPVFSVAENVVLGNEPTTSIGSLDLDVAREKVREISARFGFDIDPDAIIEDLPVGIQQRVEIVKALARDAKILILDEPTSGLDPNQVALVRELIKRLSKHSTVIFSTHILSEVELICERAIILIDGKIQKDANLKELASGSGALVAVVADSDEPQRPLTSPGKAGVKTAEGVAQKLGTLPGVTGVVQRSGHRDHLTYELQGALDASICRDIYRLAREETWELGELRPLTHNLETTFRDVVQSAQVTPKRQPQSGEVSA